ncbi:MAG: HPr family phosphocarrier protein [Candidatus Altiarchaeota archaeon]
MSQGNGEKVKSRPTTPKKQEQPEVKSIEPKRIETTQDPKFAYSEINGIKVFGPNPVETDEKGDFVHNSTVFPDDGVIVTSPRMHAYQILRYADFLAGQSGRRPEEEESRFANQTVRCFTRGKKYYIRVEEETPESIGKYAAAAELLENFVEPTSIKFTEIRDQSVREQFKRRGKYHLVAPEPMTDEAIRDYTGHAYVHLNTANRYYHMDSGERLLTPSEFEKIRRDVGDREKFLGRLHEIVQLNADKKLHERGEVELYNVDEHRFSIQKDIKGFLDIAEKIDETGWDKSDIRTKFESLVDRFRNATNPEDRKDSINSAGWRNRMYAKLKGMPGEEYPTMRLTPALFMYLEWYPGAEIKDNKMTYDPKVKPVAREIIEHFHGRFPNLEYVNIGRIKHKLVEETKVRRPGREVYLVMLRNKGEKEERAFEVREQKVDVKSIIGGFLKEGRITEEDIRNETEQYKQCLKEAQKKSLAYKNYVNNRIIINNMLGMRMQTPEPLSLENSEEYFIWKFIPGIETSSIPSVYFGDKSCVTESAVQMGRVAAINMITGRRMFDMGTEVASFSKRFLSRGQKPGEIMIVEPVTTLEELDKRLDDPANTEIYAQSLKRILSKAGGEGLGDREFDEIKGAFYSSLGRTYNTIRNNYLKNRDEWRNLFANVEKDEYDIHNKWLKVLDRLEKHDDPRTITRATEQCLQEIEDIRKVEAGEGLKWEKIERGYGMTGKLVNQAGLHGRPAKTVAAAVKHYKNADKSLDVQVYDDRAGNFVPAESVISLLLMAATKGTDLHFHATCDDERIAKRVLNDIGHMINVGFHETMNEKGYPQFNSEKLEEELGYQPGVLRIKS